MARASKKSNGATGKANGSSAYDSFKEFEGKKYTGMKVGRGHKWIYESGEWTEKKVTPDKWEFRYAVTKRRKGKAPEGSGVPVGTEYHWYILAHQTVGKLDANSYSTDMAGLKYKLSHKRADKGTWSASDDAQRKRLIKILKDMIAELERPAQASADAATDTPRGPRRGESTDEPPRSARRPKLAARSAPRRRARKAA